MAALVTPCTAASHAALVSDAAAFAELDQIAPWVDDDGTVLFYQANCRCGSTLAREIGGGS